MKVNEGRACFFFFRDDRSCLTEKVKEVPLSFFFFPHFSRQQKA